MKQQQFEQIMQQYQNLVYTICFQIAKDEQQAQDLTQETFISAWKHFDTCDKAKAKAWLCRIAVNKSKDYLKSAAFRKVSVYADESLDLLVVRENLLQTETESKEAYCSIANTICAMKEPYRSVCIAVFLQGLSASQTSEMLHRPLRTVHTQIFRARKLLQTQLTA